MATAYAVCPTTSQGEFDEGTPLVAKTDAQARREAAKLAKASGWQAYAIEFFRDSDNCRGTIEQPASRPVGRPPGSRTSDRDVMVRARVSAPQRETWEALGGAEWLRAQLDRHDRRRAKA